MLARVMGLSEKVIDEACEDTCDFRQSSLVGYADFELLYFEMFTRVQPEPTPKDFEDMNATGRVCDSGALLETDYDK